VTRSWSIRPGACTIKHYRFPYNLVFCDWSLKIDPISLLNMSICRKLLIFSFL
jgi:hypothetical protein